MKVGDKVYEAWVPNTKGLVMYHEFTIKEITKDDVWLLDKYKNEQYERLSDVELNYGRTKQEAIDRCIKQYKIWIADFEKKIKILEAEKEKINGN